MDNSNIPLSKQKPISLEPDACDYEAFCRLRDIKDNIGDFVEEGKSLYIMSSTVGNGKTSWALKLLMKYFEDCLTWSDFSPRGVIVHVPTLLIMCKDFKTVDAEFETLKKRLLSVDLVVWDDIAGSTMSNYDYSQLLMFLDARAFKGLSNIFTGNITDRDTLVTALGSKMASRMWNNQTEIIEFHGGERR